MSGTTPRVEFYLPEDDGSEPVDVATDLNDNLEKIDSVIGFVPATDATPPTTTFDGMGRYNTDSGKVSFLKGVTWTQLLSAGASFVGDILLDTANKIGIGTLTPSSLIEVVVSNIVTQSILIKFRQSTDTHPRMQVDSDGIRMGAGNAIPDVRIYRPTSNQIAVTGEVSLANSLSVTGDSALANLNVSGDLDVDGDVLGDLTVVGNFAVQGIGKTVYARKTAQTSRSSNIVPSADNHMTIAVAANCTYEVEIVGFANGLAAADLRGTWSVPVGSDGFKMISGPELSMANRDASLMRVSGQAPTVEIGYGLIGAALPISFHEKGLVRVGATAGNIAFSWAQVVSNATATIMMPDSYIRVTRVE